MNKDNRGTIHFCENWLKGNLLYLWELNIYGESSSKIGSWCHSVNYFHIVWPIFTSIQIFSLIHCYLCTTLAPILSWAYSNTPAILLNRSDSVAVLLLAAILARINKRKWSSLKKIVYTQSSPALCQQFFPYKPHTKNFLTFQSKCAPEEELCLNNN